MEVKSMLYVLSDMKYLTEAQILEIRLKAEETRNLTLAFIKYLRGTLTTKSVKQRTTPK